LLAFISLPQCSCLQSPSGSTNGQRLAFAVEPKVCFLTHSSAVRVERAPADTDELRPLTFDAPPLERAFGQAQEPSRLLLGEKAQRGAEARNPMMSTPFE
jgi:hypothetical protein